MRRRRSSFKFPRAVSVDNGRTLSIPIIDRQVPAQRLALYQAETAARNPLAAIRLTNDGDSGLPPGIITIYERDKAGYVAYVGDARLSGFPVGETRLLAYALDEKITVERDAAQTDRIATGTIAQRRAAPVARRSARPRPIACAARPRSRASSSSCSAGCRAGRWSSPTPRASSSARATTASRSSCRAATRPRPSRSCRSRPSSRSCAWSTARPTRSGSIAQAREFDAKTREALDKVLQLQQAVAEAQRKVTQARRRAAADRPGAGAPARQPRPRAGQQRPAAALPRHARQAGDRARGDRQAPGRRREGRRGRARRAAELRGAAG